MALLVSRATQSSDPFDLSPYYSRMDAQLAGWSADIGWPTQPTTSSTVQVSTSAGLISALTGSNNVRVEVTANITLASSVNVTAQHIRLVCPNDVTVSGGSINCSAAQGPFFFAMEGGNYVPTSGTMVWRSSRDCLLTDVYIEALLNIDRHSTLGLERVSIIDSTLNGAPAAQHGLLVAQGATTDDKGYDLFLLNVKRTTNTNYSARIQNVERVLDLEYASNMDGLGDRSVRYTAVRYAVTGGTAGRLAYGHGDFFINYRGDSNEWPYGISDGDFGYIVAYSDGPRIAGGVGNIPENSGVLHNYTHYSSSTGVGSQPTQISPFTTGSNVLNVQAWSGLAGDLPDVSSYGAQR